MEEGTLTSYDTQKFDIFAQDYLSLPWYQGSAVSPASAQRPHVKYLGRGRFTSKSKFMRFMSSPMLFCVNKISQRSILTKNPPNKTNVKSTMPPNLGPSDFLRFSFSVLFPKEFQSTCRWWFQPIWKDAPQIGSFPQVGRGENSKNIWSFTT